MAAKVRVNAAGNARGNYTAFDARFYQNVLPDRVTKTCESNPQQVPAVTLCLSDGSRLDMCHVVSLDDTWLLVACFRDAATCDDMDLVFLPYGLVARVTVSLHHPQTRKLGFDAARSEANAVGARSR